MQPVSLHDMQIPLHDASLCTDTEFGTLCTEEVYDDRQRAADTADYTQELAQRFRAVANTINHYMARGPRYMTYFWNPKEGNKSVVMLP